MINTYEPKKAQWDMCFGILTLVAGVWAVRVPPWATVWAIVVLSFTFSPWLIFSSMAFLAFSICCMLDTAAIRMEGPTIQVLLLLWLISRFNFYLFRYSRLNPKIGATCWITGAEVELSLDFSTILYLSIMTSWADRMLFSFLAVLCLSTEWSAIVLLEWAVRFLPTPEFSYSSAAVVVSFVFFSQFKSDGPV